jgi:hypothetical protein
MGLKPAATLDAGREESEGYGLGRKSRVKKVAAKRRPVNATSTVLLPILKLTVECGLKILQATPSREKENRKYPHSAGGRKRFLSSAAPADGM